MNVEWYEPARDQLADIYTRLSLDEQRAFVPFVQAMEARLATDALFLGESRGSPHQRAWFTGRLAVVFRLRAGRVLIVHVRPLKHGAVNDDPD